MAAMAGLLNRMSTAGPSLAAGKSADSAPGPAARGAEPMAAAGAGSTGSSSATISSNDFLTLLVTEMKNQDPTANSDPNEYINQLVQVNSLEQLISINQDLSTALGTGSAGSGKVQGAATAARPVAASASAESSDAATPAANARTAAAQKGGTGVTAAISQFANSPLARSAATKQAPGNLSVPTDHPAARQVAHALDGHRASRAGIRPTGQ